MNSEYPPSRRQSCDGCTATSAGRRCRGSGRIVLRLTGSTLHLRFLALTLTPLKQTLHATAPTSYSSTPTPIAAMNQDFVSGPPPLHEEEQNGKRPEPALHNGDAHKNDDEEHRSPRREPEYQRARPETKCVDTHLDSTRAQFLPRSALTRTTCFSVSRRGIVQVQPLRREEMQPSYAQVRSGPYCRETARGESHSHLKLPSIFIPPLVLARENWP